MLAYLCLQVVSGGVACNQYIRAALQKLCSHTGYQLFCPPPKLCTDNGIMIAWNGMERWKARTGVLYNKQEIEDVTFEARYVMIFQWLCFLWILLVYGFFA